MKYKILTLAFHYSFDKVKFFVESIITNCPNTKILIFKYKFDKVFWASASKYKQVEIHIVDGWYYKRLLNVYLKLTGKKDLSANRLIIYLARLFSFNQKILASIFHVHLSRYIYLNYFIKNECDENDFILLSDSRDVILQQEFELPSVDIPFCGVESQKIKESRYNTSWIKRIYGGDIFQELKEKPVLCAGVIGGKKEPLIDLIDHLIEEATQKINEVFLMPGADQAILNKIHYLDNYPLYKSKNGENLISTIGHKGFDDVEFDPNRGICVAGSQELVKIVHQYDREEKLNEWVEIRYS